MQVGSGYQVALKLPGADQYTVWNTDGNGNVTGNAVGGIVSGSNSALQGIEASFQQDLNGDGTIGLVTTNVELSGATSLEQVGNSFLKSCWRRDRPSALKYGGPVTVGQYAGWTFIGAEKTASGYEVASGCPFAPGASGNVATEDLVNMLKSAEDTGIDLERLAVAVEAAEVCTGKPLGGKWMSWYRSQRMRAAQRAGT